MGRGAGEQGQVEGAQLLLLLLLLLLSGAWVVGRWWPAEELGLDVVQALFKQPGAGLLWGPKAPRSWKGLRAATQ